MDIFEGGERDNPDGPNSVNLVKRSSDECGLRRSEGDRPLGRRVERDADDRIEHSVLSDW